MRTMSRFIPVSCLVGQCGPVGPTRRKHNEMSRRTRKHGYMTDVWRVDDAHHKIRSGAEATGEAFGNDDVVATKLIHV